MYCTNCGAKVPKNAKVCGNCGQLLNRKGAASSPAPAKGKAADSQARSSRRVPIWVWVAAALAVAAILGLVILTNPTGDDPSQAIALGVSQTQQAARLLLSTNTPQPIIPAATQTQKPPTETVEPPAFGGGHSGQIAFASNRGGDSQIWLIDIDGNNPQPLTDQTAGACQPAWSQDGQMLAFISPCAKNQSSYPGSAVYLLDLQSGNVQLLTAGGAGDFDPKWSPDGNTIAFTSLRNNNRPQIYLVDINTKTERPFSLTGVYEYQPIWSPDGDQMAYVTTALGDELIYLATINPVQRNQFQRAEITDGKSISSPSWSQDGKSLLFNLTPQSGGFSQINISTIADNGFSQNALFGTGVPSRDASLSPDGTWLAFEGWPNTTNHDIWLATIGGGQMTPLTDDSANDFDAAWRP